MYYINLKGGVVMEKHCIGVIGIVDKKPRETTAKVNDIISSYRDIVIGRMGIPRHDNNVGLISVIVEGDAEKINAFETELKKIDGLIVSMALSIC